VVDERLLLHWKRERAARLRARASLPARMRADRRPEVADACDRFVERIKALREDERRR
jgi:hypothetical protein